MSARPGSRTAPPADADDLRVEQIAAQLEEAEQQRLTDDWIEGATRAREAAVPRPSLRASVRHSVGTTVDERSEEHERSR